MPTDLVDVNHELRALTDELRGRELPAAAAVTVAARQLGARPQPAGSYTRARSLAAAASLGVISTYSVIDVATDGLRGSSAALVVSSLVTLVALVALVTRRAWAHPFLLGLALCALASSILWTAVTSLAPEYIAIHAVLVALVAPWHRRERTRANLALTAQTFTIGAALLACVTDHSSGELFAPTSIYAAIAGLVAVTALVTRARSAPLASLMSLGLLGVAAQKIYVYNPDNNLICIGLTTIFYLGLAGALVAAALGRKPA